MPNTNLGLAMPQAEFILAVRMWLAIPIFSNLTHVLHVCAVKLLTNLETTSVDVGMASHLWINNAPHDIV